ncbi:MAG: alkaline phosphatase family protein, partial [bacterium]|nr:alkaline phosphatase family protein [bacterium]
ETPISGRHRKVKALWNILSEQGLGVAVVNWMATWPSEPVNGFMVSDNNPWRAAFATKTVRDSNSQTLGITYPASLLGELSESLSWLGNSGPENVLDLPFFDDLTPRDRDQLSTKKRLLDVFRIIYDTDRFAAAAAVHLQRQRDLNFLAVYMSGIDNVSHRFGRRPGVVDRYYEFIDARVGDILREVDEDTTVLIVSDHGFGYQQGSTFGHEHGPDGVLLMSGPGIKQGLKLSRSPSIVDITPSVLALLGFPSSRDMEGTAIREAMVPEAYSAVAAVLIDSYGPYMLPALTDEQTEFRIPGDLELETLEKLKTLGYVK